MLTWHNAIMVLAMIGLGRVIALACDTLALAFKRAPKASTVPAPKATPAKRAPRTRKPAKPETLLDPPWCKPGTRARVPSVPGTQPELVA